MRKTRVKSLFLVLLKKRRFSLKRYSARTSSWTAKKPVVAASNRGLCSSKIRWVPNWCAREDLNLQSFRNQILSLARLPFRHARVTDLETLERAEPFVLTFCHR